MLLALGTSMLMFSLIILFAREIFKNRIIVEKRLESLTLSNNQRDIIRIERTKKKKSNFFGKFKIIEKIENELHFAGILMRAEEFLIIWIILVFVPSGVFAILFKNLITSFALVIIGAVLPIISVKRGKKKRMDQFSQQLGDSLITLGNCLRSGLSIVQGIQSVGDEMQDPIGYEFRRVFREINYGISIEKALERLTTRVKCEELDLIVSAIIIQREIGGNLSVILDNVAVTIRERLKIKEEIKVMTATGRMSGMVVGILPIGIGIILMIITPDYISAFFESPIGPWMLFGAALLEFLGFFIIQKIVTVKY